MGHDTVRRLGRMLGQVALSAGVAWAAPALPLWAADRAVDFDGVDGYVDIASPSDFAFLGNKDAASTIALWGKLRSSSDGIIGASGASTGTNTYFRLGFGSDHKFYVTFHNGSKETEPSTTAVALNQWVHVVFVKANAQYTFYINGVAAGSDTLTQSPVTNQRLVFGARTHHTLDGFAHGALDEVRIYNRVLSQAEITAQYNNGVGHYGDPEAGLVGGWHFDNAATDYSGNGHTGTLQGGTTWVPGLVTAPSQDTTPPVITITSPLDGQIIIAP